MTDDYDLPNGFVLARADHGERVEPTDADVTLVVLESVRTGEKQLVHEDVVDYDGWLEHPVTEGAAGAIAILLGLLTPIVASYAVASSTDSLGLLLTSLLVGIGGGWILSDTLLYHTSVGDWLFRFLEWNDHRALIMARGESA